MKTGKTPFISPLTTSFLALFVAGLSPAWASTIWNGPTISFTHSAGTGDLSDQIVTGVTLTRSTAGAGLYNSAKESGATSGVSPSDTKWAVGSLANYSTLNYGACPLEAGQHPPGDIGKTFVVHLVTEDIYFSLTLTAWGGAGGAGDKSFSYTRSTAPVAPTVTLTNPAAGAVFAAPAILHLGASAAVSSGTVTNVQFLNTSGVSLGAVKTAPFTLTTTSLGAGAYSLEAVATAAGISTTSPVVNVSVVTPVAVRLSNLVLHTTNAAFNYTVNTGLSYVVQSSTNLLNWVPLKTNVASVNPMVFTNTLNSSGTMFYRVGLLPNP